MKIGSKEYYEVVALIGFKEEQVKQLNDSQDHVLEDKDKIHYIQINEALKARGKKFSRCIVGYHRDLVDDIVLAEEIVRLNTPSKLYKEKTKHKYINNELGVISIDENTGHKIYEDIVHDMGNGYCRYYIQGSSLTNTHFVVPCRPDIPEESWGQEVQSRWIQFPKVK